MGWACSQDHENTERHCPRLLVPERNGLSYADTPGPCCRPSRIVEPVYYPEKLFSLLQLPSRARNYSQQSFGPEHQPAPRLLWWHAELPASRLWWPAQLLLTEQKYPAPSCRPHP